MKKNHKFISINAESIWQNSTVCDDKNLSKLRTEGTFINMIICKCPTANTILNGERWKCLPTVEEQTRQGCPLLPLLVNTVLDVLVRPIRQEKRNKSTQIGKEVKLLSDDVTLHIENPKKSYYYSYFLIISTDIFFHFWFPDKYLYSAKNHRVEVWGQDMG